MNISIFYRNLLNNMTPAERLEFFKSLNRFLAPLSWSKYAVNFKINEVWLVDDLRLDQSRVDHINHLIVINTRAEAWHLYQKYGARTPEESRLLAFLHELGHKTKRTGDVDTDEEIAWKWATNTHKSEPQLCTELLHDYCQWANSHHFENKIW